MKQLWQVYHESIPEFLREFVVAPPVQRLRQVGMNCGCEYTGFSRFADLAPYSRYDHSLGVALIVWHFTGSMEQTLAGLFHDVTTPVFAHVVDFLNGDHLRQESTEAGIADCLVSSPEIGNLLKKYGVSIGDVEDYHRYPIADNDSPALSADRLEYTLGNLLNYGFANLQTIRSIYEDLIVGQDEQGREELAFRTPEVAQKFACLALKNSYVYVADEDRFAMEALARLLRKALGRGVLTSADLLTTEPTVIAKMVKDANCSREWNRFCGYRALRRQDTCPDEPGWLQVDAKKRWIDPLTMEKGRVSQWNEDVRAQIDRFRTLDFSHWMYGVTGE